MLHAVEDGQGFLPQVAGGSYVSANAMRLAQAHEGLGAGVALADVCIGTERLLVERDCLIVTAGPVAAVAQTVQRRGFAQPVSQVPVHLQGPPAVAERSTAVAEVRAEPADPVEGGGLANGVGSGAVPAQGMLCLVECLVMVALELEDAGRDAVADGLARVIVELAVQAQAVPQVTLRVRPGAQLNERIGKGLMGNSLRRAIAKAAGGGHRGSLGLRPVRVVTTAGEVFPQRRGEAGEVFPQRRGELRGMGIEAAVPGGGRYGQQHALFGLQPGQRQRRAGEARGRLRGRGQRRGEPLRRRVGQFDGRGRGVQVLVKQPADRGVALRLAGKFGDVRPQQVVQGEPAGRVFLDEVRLDQFGDRMARRLFGDAGQPGRGR